MIPQVIERDLRRIKAMNLNAVSVFIHHESLGRSTCSTSCAAAKRSGLHVNQSLRPGTPMDFQWQQMKELIEYYRLAENDTVFAYDLAWEPSHGSYAQQERAYAAALDRLGPQALRRPARRRERLGRAHPATARLRTPHFALQLCPPMAQLTHDGEWRKLVADYRLFLDDLLREKYSAARQLVKSIDPHHAVSFRMSNAGDPTYNWDAALPYDFYGLADAVDIWAPEAYGRIGDWERVRAGDFTAAYARLCDARKPLMWAEMGYSVWDMNRMAPGPGEARLRGPLLCGLLPHDDRVRRGRRLLLVVSRRVPAGREQRLRHHQPRRHRPARDEESSAPKGQRFSKPPSPPTPDYWIAVDRDRDARGLFGIYEAANAEFWKAHDPRPPSGAEVGAQAGHGNASLSTESLRRRR